ncbi:PH-domain-containing protein [Lichtheimia hyalospora FSU 10163]|nr:PH-domain-containing protein [Lichtheimia hyalospora FSU 10163]
MHTQQQQYSSAYDTPMAGWLAKMTPLPFGRSRWQDRFFVLLDTELRYYKDDHVVSPSGILNLRQIRGAVAMAVDQQSYCIRLEPHREAHIKPWTIACKSSIDLQTWLDVLRQRLDRLVPLISPSPDTASTMITTITATSSISLKRPSFSWLRKQKQCTPDTGVILSEPQYHAITHNECIPRPRPRKMGPAPSLSRRRGIVLPPIIIQDSPFYESGSLCLSSPSDISSCSSLSSYGVENGHHGLTTPLHPPPHQSHMPRVLDQGDSNNNQHTEAAGLRSMPSLAKLKIKDEDASPSFLHYKERFHLA